MLIHYDSGYTFELSIRFYTVIIERFPTTNKMLFIIFHVPLIPNISWAKIQHIHPF